MTPTDRFAFVCVHCFSMFDGPRFVWNISAYGLLLSACLGKGICDTFSGSTRKSKSKTIMIVFRRDLIDAPACEG